MCRHCEPIDNEDEYAEIPEFYQSETTKRVRNFAKRAGQTEAVRNFEENMKPLQIASEGEDRVADYVQAVAEDLFDVSISIDRLTHAEKFAFVMMVNEWAMRKGGSTSTVHTYVYDHEED